MSEYNAEKLTQELIDAGFLISGCNSNGLVWDDKGNEIQEQPAVQAVLSAHDPTTLEEESIEEMIDRKVSEALASQ